jgi:hypothetical protein
MAVEAIAVKPLGASKVVSPVWWPELQLFWQSLLTVHFERSAAAAGRGGCRRGACGRGGDTTARRRQAVPVDRGAGRASFAAVINSRGGHAAGCK